MSTVKHIDVDGAVRGNCENCWRCGGSGYLPHFAHVSNGVCFGCAGTGRQKAGKASQEGSGVWSFQVGGWVWQFYGIHHYDQDPGMPNGGHWQISGGATGIHARVDSVMFQAFKVGQHRRKGVTALHARVSPEIGRKVWKAAISGMQPEAMDNEFLEIKSACAVTRNGRGVEVM